MASYEKDVKTISKFCDYQATNKSNKYKEHGIPKIGGVEQTPFLQQCQPSTFFVVSYIHPLKTIIVYEEKRPPKNDIVYDI